MDELGILWDTSNTRVVIGIVFFMDLLLYAAHRLLCQCEVCIKNQIRSQKDTPGEYAILAKRILLRSSYG